MFDEQTTATTVFDMSLQSWFAVSMTFWLVVVGVFIFHILGRLSALECKEAPPVVHFVTPSYPPRPDRIPQRASGARADTEDDVDLHLYDEAVDVPAEGAAAEEEQKKMN
jgi:hypothetical protein